VVRTDRIGDTVRIGFEEIVLLRLAHYEPRWHDILEDTCLPK
jgi:hypothetical protein